MSIKKNLRDFQDKVRDSGWRIKWIPWQEQGRAALFLGSVIYLVFFKQDQWPILAIGLAGLIMIFLGRIYAAFNKQGGWLQLTVRCIDREIQERHYPGKGNVKIVWECRLLCEFNHDGTEYKVTPEASHIAGFQLQHLAQRYLSERIQPDGTCKLWIDPRNPLHAVFDKKQWI